MSSQEPEVEGVESESASEQVQNDSLSEDPAGKETLEAHDVEKPDDEEELPLGEALTEKEAFEITSSVRTQLLVIAGPVGSGKTTLVASLFHCFQRGPFGGYCFAGSNTLIGFDKRCHEARIASGRSSMDTVRTPPSVDRRFLHLRVRFNKLTESSKDILISDLSGEDYRDVKDSIDECRKLFLVTAADHFILLVDGANLILPDKRQATKNEACMLLRCCLDAGQLGPFSLVDVLFTKWDLVATAENVNDQIGFVNHVQSSIEDRFASHLGRLRFFRVAARPEKGDFKLGEGLDQPFSSWIEDSPRKLFPNVYRLREPDDLPEFDRYLKRRLPHLFNER